MPLFGTPNSPRPPTIKERDAEIAALQAAFDEYISSSRELEDELDAELARMQDRLAESQAANSALMAQLEAQNPQYAAMEQILFETKLKLEAETKRSRDMEMAQEELEAQNRVIQSSLEKAIRKCDTLQERLCKKEDEVDEIKIELEVLKEKYQSDLEQLRSQFTESTSKVMCDSTSNLNAISVSTDVKVSKGTKNDTPFSPMSATSRATVDSCDAVVDDTEKEEYVRRLEDELEDITEQLIKSEAAVSELEAKVATADNRNVTLENMVADLKEQVSSLEKSYEDSVREGQKSLNTETTILQEKIEDLTNKMSATKEDLLHSQSEVTKSLEQIQQLKAQIKESSKASSEERAAKMQIRTLENALEEANSSITDLKDEVENLMTALRNAKADHTKSLDEIDALRMAYDELSAEGKKLLKQKEEEWTIKHDSELKEISYRYQRKLGDPHSSLSSDYENDLIRKELLDARNELAGVKRKLAEFEAAQTFAPSIQSLANSPRTKKSCIDVKELPNIITVNEEHIIDGRLSLPCASTHRPQGRSRSRVLHSSHKRSRSCSPTFIEHLERALVNTTSQVKLLKQECDSLGRQKRFSEVRVKHLEDDMSRMHQQLQSTEIKQHNQNQSLARTLSDIRDENDFPNNMQIVLQNNDITVLRNEIHALSRKMILQRDHNAQLLSKVLKLQGNIQVCCRVRPMKVTELNSGQNRLVEPLSETEVGCFDARTKTWRSFTFDKVWGPDSTQQGIFQDVEPLALSVVEGYNACIFAYGQTGSGKTYTMEGLDNRHDTGISFRTIQKLLHLLEHKAVKAREASLGLHASTDDTSGSCDSPKIVESFKYEVMISMLEIYNDEVYDLLTPSLASDYKLRNAKKVILDVKRNKNGGLEVPGLTKVEVQTLQDVASLLKTGNENRATATTNMNEHSSRSHMVLKVEVSSVSDHETNAGNLYLVDLAGSERVAKSEVAGQELKEAGHINKSLSALGNVMEALDRKSSHIPYRDSKLTYLLQDSLGGNSRTMMVVTVCPNSSSIDETICALQFAQRVRRIHLGSAQKNVQNKNLEEIIKNMTAEMKLLTKAKEISEEQLQEIRRDHSRIQERLRSNAANADKNNSDISRTTAYLRSTHAEITARWQKEKKKFEESCNDLEKTQNELKYVQQLLTKMQRERDNLNLRLQEKENEFIKLESNLRKAKEATTAATLRARTAQVVRHGRAAPSTLIPSSRPLSTLANGYSTPPHVSSVSLAANTVEYTNPTEIRKMVLSMLQEYDPSKVGKIDLIMERFKGRESYLLEKMTQRYLVDDESMMSKSVWTTPSFNSVNGDDSFRSRSAEKCSPHTNKLRTPSDTSTKSSKAESAKRSEAALARHLERMRVRT